MLAYTVLFASPWPRHSSLQRASSEDDSGATIEHADLPVARSRAQLAVIAPGVAAGFVWWTQTAPAKRLEVSRSKKSGEISDLLDELDEANREAEGQPTAGDKRVERWRPCARLARRRPRP